MLKQLIAFPVALVVVLLPGAGKSPIASEVVLPLLQSMEPPEICLMPGRAAAYQAAPGSVQAPPQGAAVPVSYAVSPRAMRMQWRRYRRSALNTVYPELIRGGSSSLLSAIGG